MAVLAYTGTHIPYIFHCDFAAETREDAGTLIHSGCGPKNNCCSYNRLWFCTELDQSASDDIELRLCTDQPTHDEDVQIEPIEILQIVTMTPSKYYYVHVIIHYVCVPCTV